MNSIADINVNLEHIRNDVEEITLALCSVKEDVYSVLNINMYDFGNTKEGQSLNDILTEMSSILSRIDSKCGVLKTDIIQYESKLSQ